MQKTYLERAAWETARAIGIDPFFARWEHVEEVKGQALVLHLPWSRVVVARTATGAAAFAADFRCGKNMWLLDSLHAVYPVEAVPMLPAARLLEFPITDKALSGFLRWGIRASGRATWPVSRDVRVVGSWTSYQDAILVRNRKGRTGVRLRAHHSSPENAYGYAEAHHSQDNGGIPARLG